jgi:hypothetical protein
MPIELNTGANECQRSCFVQEGNTDRIEVVSDPSNGLVPGHLSYLRYTG